MYAALAIFGAVLSTLVLPLPEELALLGAGFWAQAGALPPWAAWLSAWLAIRWIEVAVGAMLLAVLVLPLVVKSRLVRRQRRAANA